MTRDTKNWRVLLYILFHPVEGFEEFVYYKKDNYKLPAILLAVWVLASILSFLYTGIAFNVSANEAQYLNIFMILLQTAGLFTAWCVSNWAICTLFDGKGKIKVIVSVTAYSLLPYIAAYLLKTLVSNMVTFDEGMFLTIIMAVGVGWSSLLMVCGLTVIHEYTYPKTLFSIFLTLAGIVIVVFIIILSVSLYREVYVFFSVIFNEIMIRL
jgi:hypothetical protein